MSPKKKIIMSAHEAKASSITLAKQKNISPIQQRIEHLQKSKILALKRHGGGSSPVPQTASSKTRQTTRGNPSKILPQPLPSLITTPKLKLPSVTPLKRDNGARNISRPQTSMLSKK